MKRSGYSCPSTDVSSFVEKYPKTRLAAAMVQLTVDMVEMEE
jgi:hypothetical protein